jgi:mannose-6-phosphate isomerase-like protein (cupin superfamily)
MRQKKNIAAVAATLTHPFIHTVVGQVDDYCVYLTRFLGSYRFHSHEQDEMYLVLEGKIHIDFEDGERIELGPQESLVAKAGQVHRSGADEDSIVLMFKACNLFAE